MRIQDQIVKMTQRALDEVCEASLDVPKDMEDWCPMETACSVLAQMRELAVTPDAVMPVIRLRSTVVDAENLAVVKPDDEYRLATLELCVDEARRSFSVLCQEIGSFPDTELDTEVLTAGGGETLTMADVLALPFTRLVFHLGQIQQIQAMLSRES
jgi:hypothetical protein